MKAIKGLKNKITKSMLGIVMISLCLFSTKISAQAKTDTLQEFVNAYDSVTLSPDGTAWTIKGTGSAERNPSGYKMKVGRDITLKVPGVGEHIYDTAVSGNVDISYWEVIHVDSQCTHGEEFKGQTYYGEVVGPICGAEYDNGWFPVCADCGEYIIKNMVYAHSDQLKGINTIVGESQYYYLCPFSGSMEQGIGYKHLCDAISSNRYKIAYVKNAPSGTSATGATAMTYHMYNNDPIYEGGPTTYKDTHLRKNGFAITGYIFTGWNTKADGSGTSYADEQEVLNLTAENNAIVVLYAQWEKIETTLKVDANGGKYEGVSTYSVTKPLGSMQELYPGSVTPPSGYVIKYEENGGTAVADALSTKKFSHWEAQSGFQGKLSGNLYYFNSQTNGHTDTIKIQYVNNTIILPSTTKTNLSFAGWYYDSALTQYCGMAGDEVAFTGATTLYAKWMPLTLYSEPVYSSTVNGGKGAVNLWWEQKDGNAKIYKLYQSRDKSNWTPITTSGAPAAAPAVSQTFTYNASGNSYTIPTTGYYEISAYGGKGADYSTTYTGGSGGKVTATYWLKAGDVITSYAGQSGSGKNGGQNGNNVNGGSSTTDDGRGGGAASEVYLTRDGVKTLLLTAGGGGGANSANSGGKGGESAATTTTQAGESRDTGGGGGGYLGGKKVSAGLSVGSTILDYPYNGSVHEFIAPYTTTYTLEVWGAQGGDVPGESYERETYGGLGGYSTGKVSLNQGDKLYIYVGGAGSDYYGGYNGGGNGGVAAQAPGIGDVKNGGGGGGATHIATTQRGVLANYKSYKSELLLVAGGGGGGTRKATGMWCDGGAGGGTEGGQGISMDWSGGYAAGGTQSTGYAFGQGMNGCNGQDIGWSGSGSGGGGGGLYGGMANDGTMHNENGEKNAASGAGGSGYIGNVTDGVTLGGERSGHGFAKISCEAIETFYMTGGTNYINTSFSAKNTSTEAGVNGGDGKITIVSKTIGYYEVTSQDGVTATDFAAPNAISAASVSKLITGTSGNNVSYKLTFAKSADNGTPYYHKVESYLLSTEAHLSTSNITTDVLTTGYKGIYYYINTSATGIVGASHTFTSGTAITHTGVKNTTYYLHMAAVDKAGNISATTSVPFGWGSTEIDKDAFPPVTDSIGIRVSDFNDPMDRSPLYASGGVYYVKADGKTNFTFPATAHIKDNMGTPDYQVNTIKYNILTNPSGNTVEWASGRACNGYNVSYGNPEIGIESQEIMQYVEATHATASRSATGALTMNLDMVFRASDTARTLFIYPSAYAETVRDGGINYIESNEMNDREKYITVVTDSIVPAITGVEGLEGYSAIDMTAESETFVLTAVDEESGLAEFDVTINNVDNYATRTYSDEDDGIKDGKITITIPKYIPGSMEAMEFCGNFTVTAKAVDNVGNEQIVSSDATALALDAKLQRILEPHEPAFKRGESGILAISSWGYVERVTVEFPEGLVDLNRNYDYSGKLRYVQEETQEFMIPLTFPDGEYQIKVTGYKTGTDLENNPIFLTFTVEGSVLDELRTRLR